MIRTRRPDEALAPLFAGLSFALPFSHSTDLHFLVRLWFHAHKRTHKMASFLYITVRISHESKAFVVRQSP
jgi:hypothetical protein